MLCSVCVPSLLYVVIIDNASPSPSESNALVMASGLSVSICMSLSIEPSISFLRSFIIFSQKFSTSSERLSSISDWSSCHLSYSVSFKSSCASSRLTCNFCNFALASSLLSPDSAAICFWIKVILFVCFATFFWYSYKSFSVASAFFFFSISSLMESICTCIALSTRSSMASFSSAIASKAFLITSSSFSFVSRNSSSVSPSVPFRWFS